MIIAEAKPQPNFKVHIVTKEGRSGVFDMTPYLKYEAFKAIIEQGEFAKIFNGGYFLEWDCGADLSADTIEAHLKEY